MSQYRILHGRVKCYILRGLNQYLKMLYAKQQHLIEHIKFLTFKHECKRQGKALLPREHENAAPLTTKTLRLLNH